MVLLPEPNDALLVRRLPTPTPVRPVAGDACAPQVQIGVHVLEHHVRIHEGLTNSEWRDVAESANSETVVDLFKQRAQRKRMDTNVQLRKQRAQRKLMDTNVQLRRERERRERRPAVPSTRDDIELDSLPSLHETNDPDDPVFLSTMKVATTSAASVKVLLTEASASPDWCAGMYFMPSA